MLATGSRLKIIRLREKDDNVDNVEARRWKSFELKEDIHFHKDPRLPDYRKWCYTVSYQFHRTLYGRA